VFVIGIGANLIFTDSHFDGAVIHMKQAGIPGVSLHPRNKIEAFAGTILDTAITFAFDHNLIGLEWAGGLPGTIGAAVRGNVGAFGSEIKDSFLSAELLHIPDKKLVMFSKEEMDFSYRDSYVKQHKEYVVVSVHLQLKHANKSTLEKAKDTYFANINYRLENHPHVYPNTGSVFKNISEKEQVEKVLSVFPDVRELSEKKWHGKVSVGYLNKRLGFSGYQIGKAKVSEQHANFIDNIGGAKATDVTTIIQDIQKKHMDTFGFSPEAEVEIVH
jgi:UDP-N-acetylmuramate dehydrogenase